MARLGLGSPHRLSSFLLVVGVWVGVGGVLVQQERWPSVNDHSESWEGSEALYRDSWETCETPMCDQVNQHAQGLANLKLMTNYITKTLVTKMDQVLLVTGNSMTDFIGQKCPSAHPLLQQVMTVTEVDHIDNTKLREVLERTTTSNILTNDIDNSSEVSDDLREIEYRPEVQQSSNLYQDNLQAESQESAEDLGKLRVHDSSTISSNSRLENGQSTTTTFSHQLNRGQSTSSTLGIHQRPGKPFPSQHGRYVAPTNPRGQGGIRHNNRGMGHSRGGASRGRESMGRDQGLTRFGPGSRGRGCRSVQRGSPHWVPGLDTWCANNCAAGNCPSNQCICS
ncbi:hypothetical protein Hamer_G005146 [Homarus americanus]|uniref:Uncharacterized protein n=1 Tax=Homarus americanus TaxID=6706 RepID=A0A8J5K4G7_HOMAM|nr:hypothetical protein Hamer_G005146 [Homarus americanus]